MSGIIKPKDIPCDFVQIAEELFEQGYWSHNTKHNTANFLQAAIEAKIVSPPCYCLRWNGELQMLDFTNKPKVFAGKPWSQEDTEHYKGQTE